MADRNWDKELAKVDKQLASLSDEQLLGPSPAAPVDLGSDERDLGDWRLRPAPAGHARRRGDVHLAVPGAMRVWTRGLPCSGRRADCGRTVGFGLDLATSRQPSPHIVAASRALGPRAGLDASPSSNRICEAGREPSGGVVVSMTECGGRAAICGAVARHCKLFLRQQSAS